MRTTIPPHLLQDPEVEASEKVLRTCVHCGFCNATCPTYLLTGNELEGPRGRIYLIKSMLEEEIPQAGRRSNTSTTASAASRARPPARAA